jgi:hypothetical protein
VATAPRGRGFVFAQGRAEGGLHHFAFVQTHALPSLYSTARCHRDSIGASRLRLPPGLNATFPSFTFASPRTATSPRAPLTTSPCSHHQFPSVAIPPQYPTNGSPPSAVPRFTNTTRSDTRVPRTSMTLKSSLTTFGSSCRCHPPIVIFPHRRWATVVSPFPPYRHPRVPLGPEFLLSTTFSDESPPAGWNRPV